MVLYYIIQEHRRWVRITFGFSLCAAPLLAILVAYFRSGLGELSELEPLESGMMCCHQH